MLRSSPYRLRRNKGIIKSLSKWVGYIQSSCSLMKGHFLGNVSFISRFESLHPFGFPVTALCRRPIDRSSIDFPAKHDLFHFSETQNTKKCLSGCGFCVRGSFARGVTEKSRWFPLLCSASSSSGWWLLLLLLCWESWAHGPPAAPQQPVTWNLSTGCRPFTRSHSRRESI